MDETTPPVTEGTVPVPMTDGSAVSILQIVLGQMTVMEARIVGRMDAQAEAARNRWKSHDEQHSAYDKALEAISHRLDDHLRKEEQEDLIFDARIGPVKRTFYWGLANWKSILIVVLALVSLFHAGLDPIAQFLRGL